MHTSEGECVQVNVSAYSEGKCVQVNVIVGDYMSLLYMVKTYIVLYMRASMQF